MEVLLELSSLYMINFVEAGAVIYQTYVQPSVETQIH